MVAIEYFRRGSSKPFVYTEVDTSSIIVYMLELTRVQLLEATHTSIEAAARHKIDG